MRIIALILTLLFSLLLASAAEAQTTIFTTSLASSNTSNGGYSVRQQITTTGNSLGQISVKLMAAGGSLQTDHVSYCIANTAPNCVATPVELTFTGQGTSGGHGFSITTGQTATSDFVPFATAGTVVVVIIDISAASPGDVAYGTGITGALCEAKAATASWNTTTVTGFVSCGGSLDDVAVTQISTQTGGGATPHNLLLTGVGK